MTAGPGTQQRKFLVIQMGGLEEFILATGAFKAIREKLKDHHITLLTTAPFVDLGKHSGYFNAVVADPLIEPRSDPFTFYRFIKVLRNAHFSGVFDLQCVKRTEWYFRMIGRKKPDWNGNIEWASHPYINPLRREMHVLDAQEEQLSVAGITNVPQPDVSWMTADIKPFDLPPNYAILFPGGRDVKFTRRDLANTQEVQLPPRWRPQYFAEIAAWLASRGITPVFLGADDETALVAEVTRMCGAVPYINLVTKTGLAHITEMARHAKIAIGNDNEAMWPVAATGCLSLFIFPALVNYRVRVPRGQNGRILEQADLDLLPPKEVIRTAGEMMVLDMTAEFAKPAETVTA